MKPSEYIREHGWTKRAYRNPAGEVCLVGAMMSTLTTSEEFRLYELRLRQAIADLYPTREEDTEGFNDHVETTLEDVMLAMKYAETE